MWGKRYSFRQRFGIFYVLKHTELDSNLVCFEKLLIINALQTSMTISSRTTWWFAKSANGWTSRSQLLSTVISRSRRESRHWRTETVCRCMACSPLSVARLRCPYRGLARFSTLVFAAWQTIVRCVGFNHSLRSEQSFSIALQHWEHSFNPTGT